MKSKDYLALLLGLGTTFSISSHVLNAEPPPAAKAAPAATELSAEEKAAGFQLLFDGKSTDAWRGWNGDAFPAKGWVIEDGALKCEGANGRPNGGGGDLVTKAEFDNFDLRWEWKINAAGNSGLKYMIRRGHAGAPLYNGDKGKDYYGHEYQMLDDDAHPDAKRGATHLTASFYDVLPPGENKKAKPVGEYNESRIVVSGNRVEHYLNGAKVLEYELGSDVVLAAVKKSKFNQIPKFGEKIKSGILLQDHGDQAWFRNIRIRELKDAATKPAMH